MPLTTNEGMVQWSATDSVVVTANTTQTSDAQAIDDTCWNLEIFGHADNVAGSPATDDYINVYIVYSGGDVDGSAGDDFDSDVNGQREYLFTLDTNAVNPSLASKVVRHGAKAFKIIAEGDHTDTTSNNITCRFRYREKLAS